MTFDAEMYSNGVGNYILTKDGRRALLDNKESEVRRLEEVGFLKAERLKRAQYLVRDWGGRLFLTDDPRGLTIVRVCPYLEAQDVE